jgi:hypothetical protein
MKNIGQKFSRQFAIWYEAHFYVIFLIWFEGKVCEQLKVLLPTQDSSLAWVDTT